MVLFLDTGTDAIGTVTVGYKECGIGTATVNENGLMVSYYVYHGPSFTEIMFQCHFNVLTLNTEENIQDQTHPIYEVNMNQDNQIQEFELSLSAGVVGDNGTVLPAGNVIAIGDRVRIELNTINSDNFK